MALGSGDSQTNPNGQAQGATELPWFKKLSSPILFLLISLALVRIFLTIKIPVAVFPRPDFPLLLLWVVNRRIRRYPMFVNVPQPLQQAVSIVPLLRLVLSICRRR